jgi:hypothetical protein
MLACEGKALLVRALNVVGDEGEQKIHRVSVLKYGSGDLLCKLEDCGLLTVAELKQLVEAKSGLDPELTVLPHSEHGKLEDEVRLTDLAGLPTTELYAQTLMRVIVAQHLRIDPYEVTNDQFDAVCATLVSEPLDILDLSGCNQIHDFSGLVQLFMLSSLNVSDNEQLGDAGAELICANLAQLKTLWLVETGLTGGIYSAFVLL